MAVNRRTGFPAQGSLFSFGIFPFAVGGFLDGTNVCSMSTVVVFVSFLFLFAFYRRSMWVAGIAFLSAVFATIFFLTIGYFSAFRSTIVFFQMSKFFYLVLGTGSLILAWIYLKQWWLIKKGKLSGQNIWMEKGEGAFNKNPLMMILIGATALLLGGLTAFFSTFYPGDPYPFYLILNMQVTGQPLQVLIGVLTYSCAFLIPLLIGFYLMIRFFGSKEKSEFVKGHESFIRIIFSAVFLGTACGLFFTFL